MGIWSRCIRLLQRQVSTTRALDTPDAQEKSKEAAKNQGQPECTEKRNGSCVRSTGRNFRTVHKYQHGAMLDTIPSVAQITAH